MQIYFLFLIDKNFRERSTKVKMVQIKEVKSENNPEIRKRILKTPENYVGKHVLTKLRKRMQNEISIYIDCNTKQYSLLILSKFKFRSS